MNKLKVNKCYKTYDDNGFSSPMYFLVNRILQHSDDCYLIECDVIKFDRYKLEYYEGEEWQLYENDLNDEDAYQQISKRVYNEFLRRYLIQEKWDKKGVTY